MSQTETYDFSFERKYIKDSKTADWVTTVYHWRCDVEDYKSAWDTDSNVWKIIKEVTGSDWVTEKFFPTTDWVIDQWFKFSRDDRVSYTYL